MALVNKAQSESNVNISFYLREPLRDKIGERGAHVRDIARECGRVTLMGVMWGREIGVGASKWVEGFWW